MTIAPKIGSPVSTPTSEMFRDAIRELAAGVSIVTAGRDKEWAGMTATSVTSLSLEPPAILICINRTTSIVPFLQRYWHFAVSFLPAEATVLADRFAGRNSLAGLDRFQNEEWQTLITGAPILASALAAIDCRIEELIPRHSHLIAIGRVLGVKVSGGRGSLVHWHGHYSRLQSPLLQTD